MIGSATSGPSTRIFRRKTRRPSYALVNRWKLEPGERVGDKYHPEDAHHLLHRPERPGSLPRRVARRSRSLERRLREPPGGSAPFVPLPSRRRRRRGHPLRDTALEHSDQPGYGAIGPSTVDPRTGEVLDADILFESTMFGGFRTSWRNVYGPVSAASALEQALGVGEYEPKDDRFELSSFASAFADQGGLLKAALVASGDHRRPGSGSDEIRGPGRQVGGDARGRTHPRVAAQFPELGDTPVAKLQDAGWAAENGVYSSVMEYPSVNIAAKGKQTGPHYTPGIGSYDRWAISYGYMPDDSRAQALARQVANPRHLYGTNAESGGPGALDPTINPYDLGEDPLEWGKERTTILRELLRDLPSKVLADNSAYADLATAFGGIMNEYARAVAPAIKYLGGAYINRDHVGDPDGRLPFVNVPRVKQREALDFVVDRVFAPNALTIAPATLQRMGSNRWLHWGTTTTYNGRLDFPYHEAVLGLQSATLANLLNPFRLARIRDGETKYGAATMVTIPEMMGALTQAIWTESWGPGARTTSAVRRDLQRAYLDQMTQLVVQPADRTPADARSVARMQLKDLNRRLGSAVAAGAALDTYTRAHLEESRARIEKALSAGLEAERR